MANNSTTTLNNLLLICDSYKASHHKLYPPATTDLYCYFESRGGRFPYTVFFGLQYIIKRYLVGVVVTKEKIKEAKDFFSLHITNDVFNEEGWNYIIEQHGGHLPIRIKAVPEGTVVPVKNVLFTVENTDPKTPWLPGILETLLVQAWYPMTVATNSRIQKQILTHYVKVTHDDLSAIPFQLHDFGFRGCSSVESASLGGAAHLVNFEGTDTVAGLWLHRQYYHHNMAGCSVVASEHSTITAWGRNGEVNAYENMLEQFPNGVIACVCDSYNIWESMKQLWGVDLKEAVLERGERGGVLVLRPDSGDPATVVLKCLQLLEEGFGSSTNSMGYKMLPKFLRLIQGDGISFRTLDGILKHLQTNGWSAGNLLFGSGGALLQQVDRDTQKCAYKCSSATVSGESRDVYKEPVTDPGKTSKRGRLTLQRDKLGGYKTVQQGLGDPTLDVLEVVFEDGKLMVDHSLDDIRQRAALVDTDIDILKFLDEELLKK